METKQKYTPRPTEYAGVTFRSKSEAIFARFIDLKTKGSAKWVYESKNINRMTGERFNPDFMFFYATDCKRYHVAVVIEYKPAIPTDTYIEEFFNLKCKNVQKNMRSFDVAPEIHCVDFYSGFNKYIIFNNPHFFWEDEIEIPLLYSDGVRTTEKIHWNVTDVTGENDLDINAAKSHRFDLK